MVELDTAVDADRSADIYERLGVRPNAGRLLAREMYWARMQPLLDGARRDDPGTRAQIEGLNEALTIILDDALRARYDAERSAVPVDAAGAGGRAPAHDTPVERMAVVTLLALIAAAISGLVVGPWWALAPVPFALLALAMIALRERRRHSPGPLEALGLRPGATVEQIDVGYRARAQELLLRLGLDADAPRELDRLDRAYVAAMAAVIAPSAPAAPALRAARTARPRRPWLPARRPRPGSARRLRRGLRAALVATGRAARPLGAAVLAHGLRGARASAAAAQASLAAGRGAAAHVRTLERPGTPPPAALPAVDLERRLAASFKASAFDIATAIEPPGPTDPPADEPAAWLLLTSAVGVRRVPVLGRPIRIGSARDCDLVLPAREGVAPEHAMIWRRGDAVILHVIDPQALCLVNGEDVSWASLDDGDALAIGDVILRVEAASRSS